ncbi:DBP [Spodoptera littoralis nucleopolyhedrovirus]|uniref:DBP n=1 Tax=Spodoptera littoralis nuclear polyhedrosis virus TaxID=10456 RepID=M1K3N4_NPVSL|nr:DBP [Spodoptera littoralis nucleopolyhedrovirus]AGE89881.1 DBP [Spodoptera littoralis nucleopolyhedrovirus]AYU75219.1 DBP DNA binding protein [Spodoptera littoralis nucleopolyhedrovirus]
MNNSTFDNEKALVPMGGVVVRVDPNDHKIVYFDEDGSEAGDNGWFSWMVHNFYKANTTVITCRSKFNALKECLSFVQTHVPISELEPLARNTDMLKEKALGVIRPAHAMATTYTVGKIVNNSLKKYYFFDYANVRICKSAYGHFMKASWSKIGDHNIIFQWVMHNSIHKQVSLEFSTLCKLPKDESAIMRRMFKLPVRLNEDIISHDEYDKKRIEVEPYTVADFEKIYNGDKAGEIKEKVMIVGMVINGVKHSKSDSVIHTSDSKTVEGKQYYLAAEPMILIDIVP